MTTTQVYPKLIRVGNFEKVVMLTRKICWSICLDDAALFHSADNKLCWQEVGVCNVYPVAHQTGLTIYSGESGEASCSIFYLLRAVKICFMETDLLGNGQLRVDIKAD